MNAVSETTVSALDGKTFSGEFFTLELVHLDGTSFQIITRYDNSPRSDWKTIVSEPFATDEEANEFSADVQREEAEAFWQSLGEAVAECSYTVITLED